MNETGLYDDNETEFVVDYTNSTVREAMTKTLTSCLAKHRTKTCWTH